MKKVTKKKMQLWQRLYQQQFIKTVLLKYLNVLKDIGNS